MVGCQKHVPRLVVVVRVIEDPLQGRIVKVAEQHEPAFFIALGQGDLHSEAGLVPFVAVAVVPERGVKECSERTGEVDAVEDGRALARATLAVVGNVLVVVLVEDVVVPDDPDAVARLGLAALVEFDTAVGFLAELLGVLRKPLIVGVLADDSGREPQLPDLAPLEQLGEPLAVVLIRVGQGEHREVLLAIHFGQYLIDERVDDRVVRLVVGLGRFVVLDVDLHNDVVVDLDGGAVTAPHRPEHESSVGKFNGHQLLLLCSRRELPHCTRSVWHTRASPYDEHPFATLGSGRTTPLWPIRPLPVLHCWLVSVASRQ